jgi:integron integrase
MSREKTINLMRKELELRRKAPATRDSYLYWVRLFFLFVNDKKVEEVNEEDVKKFLEDLAITKKVCVSTQNQAFCALLFLCRFVLSVELVSLKDGVRGKVRKKVPVVLSKSEVRQILDTLDPTHQLMVKLLYGAGLRISECLSLRIKDLDFENKMLIVRKGKGDKDRVTFLPGVVHEQLREHLNKVKELHMKDLDNGLGGVFMPYALNRKFKKAAFDWKWQWAFPSSRIEFNVDSSRHERMHLDKTILKHPLNRACYKIGIQKHVTPHIFRHSFATHLLMNGCDIRQVQELLGHDSVETTMIYTHVLKSPGISIVSPLDQIKRSRVPV